MASASADPEGAGSDTLDQYYAASGDLSDPQLGDSRSDGFDYGF